MSTECNHRDDAKPPVLWLNVFIFSFTFAIAAIGVPVYAWFVGFDTATIVAFVLATGYCGMSITAGYHRLWSHRSYEAHFLIRLAYAIGGAFALQNSILHWSSDHRVHHRHVDDNDKDPYSAKRGFWYSHIGWMLRAYQNDRYNDYGNAKDLKRDAIVMWQHKYYLPLAFSTNFGLPILFGWINGDVFAALLLVGFLRLVISHHVTFFINSLAHMWGRQPYSDQNTAKDNAIVALLTYGEGYHNYHHAFQYDYRNAIKWWQFDPTKWWIKSLSYVGLAKNLKTIPEEKIAKSIAAQQLNQAQSSLMKLSLPDKAEVMEKIHEEYELLLAKMSEFYEIKKARLEMRRGQLAENVERSALMAQYQALRSSWLAQRKSWQMLVNQYA